MRAPGWYDDPTGRHQWRYWKPGWSDLAADGPVEVDDPLRPRWRRYLGLVLVGQLVLVPILGFVLVENGEKLDARAGVVQQADRTRPVASIVLATCPGERLRHIALSSATSKGEIDELLWSVTGDAPADSPITIGQTPEGMETKHALSPPLQPRQKLLLSVSTDQVKNPVRLEFAMNNVPTAGVLSYHGKYDDEEAFRTAALEATPCGSSPNGSHSTLVWVLTVESVLALVGVALIFLPYYAGPPPAYEKVTSG